MTSALFTALPVTAGDAFLLQRAGQNILVDGGSSPSQLRRLLTAAGINRIDVAVATHADQDHAGGLAGIFGTEQWSIGELWIPAFWTWRMRDLIYGDANFLDELLRDVRRLSSKEEADHEARLSPEDREGRFNDFAWENRRQDEAPRGWQSAGRGWILSPSVDEALRARVLERAAGLEGWRSALWAHALETQVLIKDLLTLAMGARVPIVPLEPGETMSGRQYRQDSDWPLIPLNASPSSLRTQAISALRLLDLSRNNEYSLVFLAPETTESPAVLFCADSDFSWWPDPGRYGWQGASVPDAPEGDVIITAPHHGSAANPRPYSLVRHWLASTRRWPRNQRHRHWVRGTSRRVRLSGSPYLLLVDPDFRHCVRCTGREASAIRADANGDRWTVVSNGCACTG